MDGCGAPPDQSPFRTYRGIEDIEHLPSLPQFSPEVILPTPPRSESSRLETHQYLASKPFDLPSRPWRSYAQTSYNDNDDLQSVTVYDDDKNAYMAETFAAPTYVPSEECGKDRSSEDSMPTSPSQLPESPFSAVSKAQMSPLEAFFKQGTDAPWNSLDLKKCDYCGNIFTKPIQREEVDRHLKFQHGISNQDPVQMYTNHEQFYASRSKPIDGASGKTSVRTLAGGLCPQNVSWNDPRRLQYNTNFLLQRLDPGAHPGRVNNFFNGLDVIIGDLHERFPSDGLVSGIRSALARLELLYRLKYGKGSKSLHQQAIASAAATDGRAARDAECPSGFKKSVNNTQRSKENDQSPAQDKSSSSQRNLNSNDRGEQPTLTSNRRRRHKGPNKKRLLACPINKHCKIHGRTPVCTFDGVDNMSEVTQHLRARVHRNQVVFLALCRHCWEYITSQVNYHESHKDGQCERRAQPRGSRVADHWLSLYRQICLDYSHIPSPFVDCDEWRAVQSSNNIRRFPERPNGDEEPRNNGLAVDQSFLDVLQTDTSLPPAPFPSVPLQTSLPNDYAHGTTNMYQHPDRLLEERAEAAATELFASMFRDSFRLPGDLNDHFMDQLMNQINHMSTEDVQAFSDRFRQRVAFILHRLQLQSQPQPQFHTQFPLHVDEIQHPVPSFLANIETPTQTGQLPFDDPANFHSIIRSIEQDDLWLRYFPVPQEMLPIESHEPQHGLQWPDPQIDTFTPSIPDFQIGLMDNPAVTLPGYSMYAANLMGGGAVPISYQSTLFPQRGAPQSVST